MDFARRVWGIPDSGYRMRAMYRNIPLGFSDTLVGATPSPGLAVFASSRTRLTAWLFHSRWSLFLHIRTGRMAATAAGAKVFLVWILHGD